MHLVRDILDNQVRDARDRKMGNVDGIVLVLRKGRPPRVAAIELGLATLLRRISRRLGRFATSVERRWGITGTDPVRIPFNKIESIGIDVRVAVEADRTAAYDWERWIRRVLIDRIPVPGGGREGPEGSEGKHK
jgi:sporulation protein YlmC with PRC-barrel domain